MFARHNWGIAAEEAAGAAPAPRVGGDTSQHQVSIRRAVGESAWNRLPEAVRERFSDNCRQAQFAGSFEVVRASCAGRLLAHVCRLIGTPIVPGVGMHIPARVYVYADDRGGMVWKREYAFPARRPYVVTSTKCADGERGLIETLPFGLQMPLEVYERAGTLNFVSDGYFFNWLGLRLRVPDFLPPGRTHVQHIDEGGGWFRFTMTVTHRWLGEVYFQTGRFRAAGEAP